MGESISAYEPVIGLEVHCQLSTDTKTFSPDPAAFGAEPNTNIDPISLGHPGTLPVLNERVLDYTIRMGLATNCSIRSRSAFARKHYFYPDLPKGYQISQYEDPICHGGWLEIDTEEGSQRKIGITRIHMEEDAGKSIHDQHPRLTLLDYNRCGVPLIEIVSEPDIRTPREATLYLQKIRQIVRYLGICDGNMEEGSLRCDANVSVRTAGSTVLGTKTEVKNMNSFRHVERALVHEIERQIDVLISGGAVAQETRLWDADAGVTRSMRSKEEAHDYRYFPDPDLVPVVVSQDMLDAARSSLPEMPDARRRRLTESLGLPEYDASVLTEERDLADYFQEVYDSLTGPDVDGETAAKQVSNFLMTEVLRVLNERSEDMASFPIEAPRLAGLVELRLQDRISSSAATQIFDEMLESAERPLDIANRRNLLQVSDEAALLPVVATVLDNNPGQVAQYLGGKEGVIGFFIGQVMRGFEGSPDPRRVRELLAAELEKRREA
jgi:aspartyl-tRNA(Asn)/glutamyl-tRNA(Gln) amidotransferase subunit B